MASRELAASHPIPIWMRGGLACALALSCAVPALANTYTVTSTADAGPGTLSQAIIDSEAQPGADTIQFAAALAGGTVTLLTVGDSSVGPAAFRINSDITIIGDAALGITIQRSSGSFRIFTIDTAGILTLRNVTLSSGRAMGFGGGTTQRGGDGGGAGMGAGLFNNAGTVSISASTSSGNSATGGGAAQGLGGGVFNRNGTVTITSSLFSGNTAAQGGGGAFNIGHGATAALNLRNVTFSGSTGSDVGEAEINSGTSTVTRIYGPACGCAPPLIGSPGGAPTMGNLAFSIAATGYSSSATGPAVLLLAGAPQAPPIPLYRQDCFLNVSPVTMLTLAIAPVTLTGTPPCTGESATPTPIPAMPWLRGVSVYLQWVAASPAAPSGFELTGALEVTLE